MDLALLNKIFIVFIDGFAVWIAFWVYFADKKNRINQTFFWVMIPIALWMTFYYFGYYSGDPKYEYFWGRMCYTVITLCLISAYFFSAYFPKTGKRYPAIDKAVVCLLLVFSWLLAFTDLVLKNAEVTSAGYIKVMGPLGNLYHVVVIAIALFAIYNVFKKYFTLSEQDKLRVQYLLIGVSFFALANIVFNVFFVYLPLDYQKYSFIAGAAIPTVILLLSTTYSIVKRELFEVKIILIQFLVGTIALVLLVTPFLIDVFWLKAVLFGIFFLFSFLGGLLIRYTLREVQEKKTLAQKVKERTMELENRTTELEKGKKKLEKSYQEIKKRKEELEKFYDLTVGREMRMIELKKKIKKLKKGPKKSA